MEDPLRAVLFRLANLSLLNENDEDNNVLSPVADRFKKAIETMVVVLLDATLNVEVVKRHKDVLVVRLTDQQHEDIPKMLMDLGVVKEE